mmetsp:Transcript_17242/g.39852  ORF Transcript_17242/g.39852 Transcript_17242/m.39852 type:complete len:145 (-) Transcript_17242:6-440(-)
MVQYDCTNLDDGRSSERECVTLRNPFLYPILPESNEEARNPHLDSNLEDVDIGSLELFSYEPTSSPIDSTSVAPLKGQVFKPFATQVTYLAYYPSIIPSLLPSNVFKRAQTFFSHCFSKCYESHHTGKNDIFDHFANRCLYLSI